MYQDNPTLDCNTTEPFTEPCTAFTTEFTTEATATTEPFSAKQLSSVLSVSERTVFNYANKLIDLWAWLPESDFRTDGLYTQKALDEMLKLKEFKNFQEYASQVMGANNKPQIAHNSALAIQPPTNTTELLETRIITQQHKAKAETSSVLADLKALKTELDISINRSNQNHEAARDARLARLKAKAMKQALQDYKVMKDVYNATVEQLEIEDLEKE